MSVQESGSVAVAIQTVAGREAALEQTCRSVQASDIGTDYSVAVHPAGLTTEQHCIAILRDLAASGRPYALRLEDDVIVNQHILHNLTTWPALSESNFGAAWAYVPACLLFDMARLGYGPKTRASFRWNGPELGGSLGVFFRTADLPAIIECMEQHQGLAQDWSMSMAVYELGKVVYFAKPSLIEHNVAMDSAMGHTKQHHGVYHTSGDHFNAQWKRGRDRERPLYGP